MYYRYCINYVYWQFTFIYYRVLKILEFIELTVNYLVLILLNIRKLFDVHLAIMAHLISISVLGN